MCMSNLRGVQAPLCVEISSSARAVEVSVQGTSDPGPSYLGTFRSQQPQGEETHVVRLSLQQASAQQHAPSCAMHALHSPRQP